MGKHLKIGLQPVSNLIQRIEARISVIRVQNKTGDPCHFRDGLFDLLSTQGKHLTTPVGMVEEPIQGILFFQLQNEFDPPFEVPIEVDVVLGCPAFKRIIRIDIEACPGQGINGRSQAGPKGGKEIRQPFEFMPERKVVPVESIAFTWNGSDASPNPLLELCPEPFIEVESDRIPPLRHNRSHGDELVEDREGRGNMGC
jgi:hypothetical protein